MYTKDKQKDSKEYQAPRIVVKEVELCHMLCLSGNPEEDNGGTEKVGEHEGTWGYSPSFALGLNGRQSSSRKNDVYTPSRTISSHPFLMKPFYALLATAALLLASCQNDQFDNDSPVSGVTFTATTEIPDDITRTSLDADGNVLWKTGDQISVFQASTINQQYQVTDASDGQTSAALNQVNAGGFVAGGELPVNVAYYPYAAVNTIQKSGDAYALTVSLPATQSYAAGSFGNGAFPMAAVTTSATDYNLKFKNVLGGLKLQLKGTQV